MTEDTSQTENRVMISIRVPPAALAEIDERAAAADLNRTQYIVRACLGMLDTDERLRDRVDDHERRLKRLEDVAYGIG